MLRSTQTVPPASLPNLPPWGWPMSNGFRLLAVIVFALAVTPQAPGKPAHKQALADYFGPFLAQTLNNCQPCPLPDPPDGAGDAADKPHNPFGARLKEVRQIL